MSKVVFSALDDSGHKYTYIALIDGSINPDELFSIRTNLTGVNLRKSSSEITFKDLEPYIPRTALVFKGLNPAINELIQLLDTLHSRQRLISSLKYIPLSDGITDGISESIS